MKQETWLPAVPEAAPVARALVREAAAKHGIEGSRLARAVIEGTSPRLLTPR